MCGNQIMNGLVLPSDSLIFRKLIFSMRMAAIFSPDVKQQSINQSKNILIVRKLTETKKC
jgi:hypothetical protein